MLPILFWYINLDASCKGWFSDTVITRLVIRFVISIFFTFSAMSIIGIVSLSYHTTLKKINYGQNDR